MKKVKLFSDLHPVGSMIRFKRNEIMCEGEVLETNIKIDKNEEVSTNYNVHCEGIPHNVIIPKHQVISND
jgi:hypothetical protein